MRRTGERHSFSAAAQESSDADRDIDQRSFRLGGIASFAEMVRVGVKTLDLSAAVSPEEMDALVDAPGIELKGER